MLHIVKHTQIVCIVRVVSALSDCMCLSRMGAGKATQLQATIFAKMFPDQGDWLTSITLKQFRTNTFSVHQLVSLLLYKVSHHCACEEQKVQSVIAWPLASKISNGTRDHARPGTLGVAVHAPLFDLQPHHGAIRCNGGSPRFSGCLGQSLR